MGNIIIKAARDRDLYVEWFDAPTAIGNRAEMLDYLGQKFGSSPSDPPEVRMQRADENGSSSKRNPHAPGYTGPLEGSWEDTGFVVEQRGWLPRARLAEFLDAYLVDPEKAYKLLDPFGDDQDS
ncbi:hypothetical protein MOQ72_34080 [Saccharopolyspora sp. K220]|uniref:hypothetical protein n=1 Tax=Saccharopolyspora soli TaxID=2926618 RepID=UPI001F5867F4|nr:hypothetical protein [Saccharopolyspora soli]MCI2422468.1 hypothetical protein [Saccharopolyspora soli]